VLAGDPQRAVIEELVMNRAQAEAVGDLVRIAVGPPVDVRSLQARREAVH